MIREIFNKYPFPVIIIEDKNIEEACKIFERIDQGGKRLGIFDLVVAATWDKDFELKKKIDDFNKNKVGSFGKIDYEVFSETISLIIKKQCTKAFQLKLNSENVKKTWPKVERAMQGSIKFLRTDLKVKKYEYLPYRDMLVLIAYYYYFQETEAKIDKKFLELWFWKAAFSNRYSGSSFNKIGEDRAYIFDEIIKGENVNINYDINIDVEKIKNINMNRQTALRNAILIILLEQAPLSFADNSPVDIEKDSISEFNKSEKHHIFPKKFLKSIGITGKKATDLVVNFCLIDSALNKNISGKRPSEYLTKFKQVNSELKESLYSHLIPSGNDSGIWEDNYNKFIEQRAKLLYTHVKKKVGDIGAIIEEQMGSSPELLINNTERKIREIINHVLYKSLGEDWWYIEKIVPQDVRGYAKEKIKKEKAQKPYISDEEWKTPMRQLE